MKLFVLLLLILSLSCSASKQSSRNHYQSKNVSLESKKMEGRKNSSDVRKGRKIIYTAYIQLYVKESDSINDKIRALLPKYKGYFNRVGTYQTIIRVKSEYLNSMTNEITKLGKVKSKEISGRDVTEEFLDNQIRLDNANKSRNRYLELLSKSENVEAALKVEKELERLNSVIDLLKGRMKRVNHLSEYATINISFEYPVEKEKSKFIAMPGLEYNLLFIENPTVDKSSSKYHGVSVKYLFTTGKSYFNLGIMKSIEKKDTEISEIFTYSYGADFFPSYLKRKSFLNIYLGFVLGGAYFSSNNNSFHSVFFNTHIGLELIKTNYIIWDIKASYFLPISNNRNFRGITISNSLNFVF